jgi:pyruvate, water dikinase
VLHNGGLVTVSCTEGDTGNVYKGILETSISDVPLDSMPPAPVKITMNVGNPELAFEFQRLPNDGVGLARLEFIVARMIGIHPKACRLSESAHRSQAAVEDRSAGYASPREFYVEKMVEGVGTLGAAFFPKPVIVRLSDFKSNEYSGLIGGPNYEPHEENPMLGFRGASRYVAPSVPRLLRTRVPAMRRVRNDMGLTNIEIMVPFIRTLDRVPQGRSNCWPRTGWSAARTACG